jgi:hypothetical protein
MPPPKTRSTPHFSWHIAPQPCSSSGSSQRVAQNTYPEGVPPGGGTRDTGGGGPWLKTPPQKNPGKHDNVAKHVYAWAFRFTETQNEHELDAAICSAGYWLRVKPGCSQNKNVVNVHTEAPSRYKSAMPPPKTRSTPHFSWHIAPQPCSSSGSSQRVAQNTYPEGVPPGGGTRDTGGGGSLAENTPPKKPGKP